MTRAAATATPAATALRVLTIVACKPGTQGLVRPVRVLPDGNTFLQDICDVIDPLARDSGGALVVAPATNIREIQKLLAKHAPSAQGVPFTVQLVGHGSAGRLALGSAWPEVPGTRTGETLFACVNELLLLKPATPVVSLAELRIVGCDVAKHDGEPLLAALSALFACDITGARGETSAIELQNGLYAGPMQRFERAGLRYVR